MLRIHVLGELVVETSGGPVALGGSWRARSLLAWLALNPGQHARGELAARFWPEVLDSSARASLRNGLWAVRKALGEDDGTAVVATRERVGLEGVWSDAAAFEEHFAAGRLDEALALCRGELLAGLEDEWVYEYRDAHRLRVSELLESMAARAEPEDLALSVTLTRRRVALDPLAEDAQRSLIERLGRAGDRSGALVAYSRFRDGLRADWASRPPRTPGRWSTGSGRARRRPPRRPCARTGPRPRPARGPAATGPRGARSRCRAACARARAPASWAGSPSWTR